jgi:hypothetical protein
VQAGGTREIQVHVDNRGTFNGRTDLTLEHFGSGQYVNSGTITIDGGTLDVNRILSFDNSGLINSVSGDLVFSGDGSASSVFSSSGTLASGGGALTLQSLENINNSGVLSVTGGDASIDLNYSLKPYQFTNTGDIEVATGKSLSISMRTGNNSTVTMGPAATAYGGGQIDITRAQLVLQGAFTPNDASLRLTTVTVSGAGR